MTSRSRPSSAGKVAISWQEIVTKAREVDTLVAEIASASTEQSQGLTQVLSAVTAMDKITQGNAASAEESAATTIEMNKEVVVLRAAIEELNGLLGLTETELAQAEKVSSPVSSGSPAMRAIPTRTIHASKA